MSIPKRILCVIDPTEDEQPALQRAAMLAKCFNAELRLFISYYSPYLAESAKSRAADVSIRAAVIRGFEDELLAMADVCRADLPTVSTHVVLKRRLFKSVLNEAKRWGADLIVKDTHYHPAIARALFTNTDWSLMRRTTVPLWLVKRQTKFAGNPRLLACVDPMQDHGKPELLDDYILETGAALADALSGELHVFHAYRPLLPVKKIASWAVGAEGEFLREFNEHMREEHVAAFAELADKHQIAKGRRIFKNDPVQTSMPATVADLGCSLAILGAVTRSRLRRTVIGSTAESIADHVPCDLLVLKPPA